MYFQASKKEKKSPKRASGGLATKSQKRALKENDSSRKLRKMCAWEIFVKIKNDTARPRREKTYRMCSIYVECVLSRGTPGDQPSLSQGTPGDQHSLSLQLPLPPPPCLGSFK